MDNVRELAAIRSIHFVGIFGSGMSAIAQYLAAAGARVSGSDRNFNSIETANVEKHLRNCGCEIFPQDGSGVTNCLNAICISTAIEDDNPDIAAARKHNIAILHRSDVLALIVKSKKTIAVAGTSGKSTVTAMIFEFLTSCGKSPSLISGAALRSLEEKNLLGNAFFGNSDLLVAEADESDGTIIKYEPYISVIHNISKDHKPEEEVFVMFRTLLARSAQGVINYDDVKLRGLFDDCQQKKYLQDDNGRDNHQQKKYLHDDCLHDNRQQKYSHDDCQEDNHSQNNHPQILTYGFCGGAQFKGHIYIDKPLEVTVTVNNIKYTLPLPGEHNAQNLMAALCVCKHLGCDDADLVRAAANFKGIDRRFAIHRAKSDDVIVIDDFAHNPEKIRAAVGAAKNLSQNLIVIYQPHGFGPTRFLKNEYAQTFCEILRPTDALCFLPIFYAGGTAQKDISSQDIIDLIKSHGANFFATAAVDKDDALTTVGKRIKNIRANNKNDNARDNNICILLMGARDPSLPIFARRIADSF